MEEWKDIRGYEGLYQVSNEGRVKSLERVVECGNQYGRFIRCYAERILEPQNDYGDEHQFVFLSKNGKQTKKYVHALIATAFIPNTNGYTIVHHKDHNPFNNRIENLEWTNRIEHMREHDNLDKPKRIVYQYTLEGELVGIWECVRDIERTLAFSSGHISKCCNGKCKTAYGYKWSYEPL